MILSSTDAVINVFHADKAWQFVLGRNIDPDVLQSGIAWMSILLNSLKCAQWLPPPAY